MKNYILTIIIISVVKFCYAQQWTGSTDVNGVISRNGNITANGFYFGRYGSGIFGDPNPYTMFIADNEVHDLMLFGSNAATLHLRLYDGDIKLGPNGIPNSVLYNNGDATFTGKVGIGITTPVDLLHLNLDNGKRLVFSNAGGVSNDEDLGGLLWKFNDGTGNKAGQIWIRGNNDSNTSGQTRLSFGAHANGAGEVSEQLTIQSNGNVGIGTTNPTSKLQISNGGQTIYLATGTNTSGYALNIGVNDDGVNFSNNSSSRGFNFSNNSGNLLKITSGGNVGIGTTTPDAKLSVNGTIHTKEVKVDLTGWSDFVFDRDYKLQPLSEVAEYIKSNKHLPGVPSQKEVEENGVNLGEMNKILLQKIEELTLHLIELKKENDQQDKLIQELATNKK